MSIYDFYSNDELLTVRNYLRTNETQLLFRLLNDFINETAYKQNLTAEEIKGMNVLSYKLKTLSSDLENQLENRK